MVPERPTKDNLIRNAATSRVSFGAGGFVFALLDDFQSHSLAKVFFGRLTPYKAWLALCCAAHSFMAPLTFVLCRNYAVNRLDSDLSWSLPPHEATTRTRPASSMSVITPTIQVANASKIPLYSPEPHAQSLSCGHSVPCSRLTPSRGPKLGAPQTPLSNNDMRLALPPRTRKFGSLLIAEEARVLELDTRPGNGKDTETDRSGSSQSATRGTRTACFSGQSLDRVLTEMVIVVPCKNEELSVIEGVISAIPAHCLVILVSNCWRREDGNDQYKKQVNMVKEFGGFGRQILAIHQKDVAAAAAFRDSGMSELIDPADGTIRNGKGEGMLLGVALAAAFCPERRYIGFVDADNFNAGSVNEYCKAFAAGFAMSPHPELEDTMVRLRWASKPKLRDGRLDFVTEGRCSKVVNEWLNKLLAPSPESRNGTCKMQPEGEPNKSFVTTGNAGEHAMTMHLALKLRMAAGYAIEPFHFINLLEMGQVLQRNGGHNPCMTTTSPELDSATRCSTTDKPVRVFQVRTLSPHLHRSSGDEHIRRMWAAGLGSIFHGLAPYHAMPRTDIAPVSELRQRLRDYAATNKGIDDATGELPSPTIYPALEGIDMQKFRGRLAQSSSLKSFGLVVMSNLLRLV